MGSIIVRFPLNSAPFYRGLAGSGATSNGPANGFLSWRIVVIVVIVVIIVIVFVVVIILVLFRLRLLLATTLFALHDVDGEGVVVVLLRSGFCFLFLFLFRFSSTPCSSDSVHVKVLAGANKLGHPRFVLLVVVASLLLFWPRHADLNDHERHHDGQEVDH